MTHRQQILEVKNLSKFFPIQKGLFSRVVGQIRAVDDVSLNVYEGETLGLVGESGCGKTTLARAMVRLLEPSQGEILYYEMPTLTEDLAKLRVHIRNAKATFFHEGDQIIDLAQLSMRDMGVYRREIQMIFQDPYASLNPRMRILDTVGEPLMINGIRDRKARAERVVEMLRLVGLRPEYIQRYPHALSGGERQRVGIARALIMHPRLVVADEPVSALDVSVQAQVLNLLQGLQAKLGLTYIFVAHNLSVVKHITERIAVMYVGKIVEIADTGALFRAPKHPYTAALISCIPVPDPEVKRDKILLKGEPPSPANPPKGCHFHPRCPYAVDVCRQRPPTLQPVSAGHHVSCHRANELDLAGTLLQYGVNFVGPRVAVA